MNKLYFKYGTVNSSKSANLLMIKHNYEEQGFKVWVGKPEIDTRDGAFIATRAGIEKCPCYMIGRDESIIDSISIFNGYDVIMVDEAQFLSEAQVYDFWIISNSKPVLMFGLLTDSNQRMFEGSKRIMELAESIEKIKTVCKCGSAANYTIRVDKDGKRIVGGKQIEIGGSDRYKAVCKDCLVKYQLAI